MRIMTLGLVAVILVGCDGGKATRTERDSLHIAQSLLLMNHSMWKTAGIRDYEFTYAVTPIDCPNVKPLPAVVISVKNGAVSSVYDPTSGTFDADFSAWPTLDLLFEELIASAENSPYVFSKTGSDVNAAPIFDGKYGFPTDVRVDISVVACDGVEYRISNFK